MSDFLVAGLGASAGGVQALKEFFTHVPHDSGIAYVVILHLSPSYDSKLAELLRTVASIPVVKVMAKAEVKPDTIYVIPPNQHLIMKQGCVDVSPNMVVEDRRAPVDIFFRSLAESHGNRAVCVVLSGTGANGSMGMKRIKERGGVAFVQNPREAEFNEMPRNSIATNLVDEVLNVADIPAKIIRYRDSRKKVHVPVEMGHPPEEQQQALRDIFTQLRIRTGHDFSNYKRPTLLRRIERRINIHSLNDLPSYAAYLQDHPEEITSLLKDLLISVTNFFRDRPAFDELEHQVLPAIIRAKTAEDRLRVWVAGCATGEEAYSVAMIIADLTMGVLDAPKVQVFATDIDEEALAHAHEGYYTINDAADVSAERLRRYFNKEGNGYRIRREIREMILFARHNFLKDPPFSHLDLIACRNVLIYLNQIAQERVMNIFHFALDPGGYLLLGNAESIADSNDRYITFNREQHIYQTRRLSICSYPIPDVAPISFTSTVHPTPVIKPAPARSNDRISFGELHQQMLEQYAPPSLIVNEEYEILHISERAGRYLQVPGGSPSQNLLSLIRQELRLDLRSALYQATQQQIAVDSHILQVAIDDLTENIIIQVRPVLRQGDPARGFILIIFEQVKEDSHAQPLSVLTSDEPVTKHLEAELIRLKMQLRNSNEEHELQAEELKASNEELQAMIEELRSATEELETSKEELQSINEELTTVNQELKVRVEESSIMSNNLQNLINSADIGTVFLDRRLRVMLFTPAARSIFNLIPADNGRQLSDITNKLVEDGLQRDAEEVLEKLATMERIVHTTDHRMYLMRLSPYRTEEDRIQGVVMSFVNLTERALAEAALQESEERLRLILESAHDYAIFTLDKDRRVSSWNTGAQRIFGYTESEMLGQSGDILFVPEDRATGAPLDEAQKAFASGRAENERWHRRKDDSRFYGSGLTMPLRNATGEIIGFVKIMRDLTESNQAQEALRKSEERLRVTMESATDYAIITNNEEGIIDGWSLGAERTFGYTAAETIGQPVHIIFTPEDIAAGVPATEMQAARENGRAVDERWHLRKDGSRFYMSGTMRPILNPALTGYVKVARDMTEAKQTQEALRITEERYRIALQAADMGAWDWHIPENKILWNEQHYSLLGLPVDMKEKTPDFFLRYVHPDDVAKVKERLEAGVAQCSEYEAEYRLLREDGTVRWMNGYGRVVEQTDGKATRMVGVMYDITTRVKATMALQDKQLKLEIAQRAGRVGIWGYDLARQQGIATPELIELAGYPYPGETWELEEFLKLVYPEDRSRLAAIKVLPSVYDQSIELEFRLQHPQRGILWMLMRGSYTPHDDRINATLMGSLIDITERKAFEQQKDQFIGIASHELKTPVTSIKAYAEILQEIFADAGDAEHAALMSKLGKQIDRLTGLIHSLLDATMVTGGQLQLNKTSFTLDDLIADTAEVMQHTTASHRFELSLEAGNCAVYGDRERIRQVLINLMSNAIKYSPGADRVVVSSECLGDTVKISIQDFGIGISEEVQPRVFERFFRASDPGIATFPGLGLGLFISAEIVRMHEGIISLTSNKGVGSTFYFTLPVVT
jgi:two-component system CheB/CheR fusion protein